MFYFGSTSLSVQGIMNTSPTGSPTTVGLFPLFHPLVTANQLMFRDSLEEPQIHFQMSRWNSVLMGPLDLFPITAQCLFSYHWRTMYIRISQSINTLCVTNLCTLLAAHICWRNRAFSMVCRAVLPFVDLLNSILGKFGEWSWINWLLVTLKRTGTMLMNWSMRWVSSETKRGSVDNVLWSFFSMNFSPKSASPPVLSLEKRNHLSQFRNNGPIEIIGRFYYHLSRTHPALHLPFVASYIISIQPSEHLTPCRSHSFPLFSKIACRIFPRRQYFADDPLIHKYIFPHLWVPFFVRA